MSPSGRINNSPEISFDKNGLGLNTGTQFGPGGEGFMRLNFGCPRSLLERAMKQLKVAIDAT